MKGIGAMLHLDARFSKLRRVLYRFGRGLVALCFSAVIVNMAISYFDFNKSLLSGDSGSLALAGLALTAYALFGPVATEPAGSHRLALLSAVACLTFLPFVFVKEAFGTKDLGSILITIQENDLDRGVTLGLQSFSKEISASVFSFIVICAAVYLLGRTLPRFRIVALAVIAGFLLFNPLTIAGFRFLVPSAAHALVNPDVEIGTVRILSRPDRKKNLIIIYMESVERTYRDLPATRAAFKKLADIEDRGLAFTGIGQVMGTHFTAGGLVASQCGVPLLPKGMFNVNKKLRDGLNLDMGFKEFLGGVECLGDVLAREGYLASYMNGSELAIFAKGDFFQTHKYQRVFGRDSLANPEAEPRQNIWGLDDDYIFEKAKQELAYLSGQNKPFVLSMLTIATHGPDAFVDAKCKYPVVAESMIPPAIQCTGDHVQSLIDELDRLGLTDDTMIVLMSDHLAMTNTLEPSFDAFQGERKNFLTVLGAYRQGKISKPGTTMDVYPTILELLGYKLADGRANMGVSLVSGQQTMAMRLGIDQLDAAITNNTALQRRIWRSGRS